MEELVKTIGEQTTVFNEDATLQAVKGNKTAGLRARKVALELIKNLKEFRKLSMVQANS